ncbi:class F sortase [Patescibacteria group bacterium]|nr:MAG: class F sortase [Patescibacteria group bacterium]
MVRLKKRSNRSSKRGTVSRTQRKVRLVLFVVGLVLVGVGLNAVRNWYNIKNAGVPAGHTVATISTDAPSEQPVPDSYSVPADKPLSIQLPTIKTEGFIQQVGVDKENQMVVPSNVNMAGWYTKGALPGDDGLSIIDGHVHGLYAKGIFYNLGKLKAGDIFSVTYGDKSVRKFKVKQVQTVSTKEADTALFVRDKTIPKQLNLITCTGRFDKESKTYDSRVIVVAEAF